jgi:dissimilatory sulfite reductase (desulfoviridin) alpha/beta subunit/TusA-related sulfurtransferase
MIKMTSKPKSKTSRMSVEEKLRRTRLTIDCNLEDHRIGGRVAVGVQVAGARGEQPLCGQLSYDQLRSGGYIKQRQRDLFTVRCRSPGGRVSAAWLRVAADACEQHGRGFVHLTFRQSIEVPYVHLDDFPAVTGLLAAAGYEVATCGPRVRVPTACGGCEYNPNGLTDTQAMAALVDREFFGDEHYHKFKISFSGCPIDCARTNEADLGFQGASFPRWDAARCTGCTLCAKACLEGAIVPDPESGAPRFDPAKCLSCADCIRACPTSSWQPAATGWMVRVGGRHGRHPLNGALVAQLVTDDQVVPLVRAVLAWYREHGRGAGRTRIGELLRAPGALPSLTAALEPIVGRAICEEAAPPEPIQLHHRHGPPRLAEIGAPAAAEAPAPVVAEARPLVDRSIDVTGIPCPGPFARMRMALGMMRSGERLEVLLDEDALATAPKSLKEEGHRVLGVDDFDDGRYRLVVQRG